MLENIVYFVVPYGSYCCFDHFASKPLWDISKDEENGIPRFTYTAK